jgi:formate hydrogenlyase transcriptional activator
MSQPTLLDSKHLDFYESTLNNLTEGVVWTDSEGNIVYVNQASSQWLGQSKLTLVGQSIFSLFSTGNFKTWLDSLESNRNSVQPPFDALLKSGDHVLIYAMVSISVGNNKYNSFLLKSESQEGNDPNEMLRIISEGTAAVIGGDFFRSLAYHVIISTGIRYAMVTECMNAAKDRVRTLVYIERDTFLDNFQYDLTGTPCEIVMKGEDYYCTSDLDALFPKDDGVKAYFGVPIYLSNGEVIGHIAIFDTKPMSISNQKLNILKIFASRAGAEIERKRKDEQIDENMARYKSLFEESPIGLSQEDYSEVKNYIDALKKEYETDLDSIYTHHPEKVKETYQKVKRLKANKSQIKLFDVRTEQAYFEYMENRFIPDVFKDSILTFESGELVFDRVVDIKTASGEKKIVKVKRIMLPGAEFDWSESLISCVDITEQKEAQESLKTALKEVKQLKERLEAENIYLQQEIKLDHNFEEIISKANSFKPVLEKVQQVADTDATVLILGESGTGKELIARAIHSISKRSNRPLVKVNCATLPANLIESELFGHDKGAFTGAIQQKIGRFELASGGTLFLDEIGEIPIELQSKLLRVLQEGEFERLGSSKTMKVDVRIIAATNRELETSVNNKEFRADLYYRLNVFPIYSPPLRDRKEDVPVLVTHFLKKYGTKMGKKINSISKPALDLLLAYDWPGNVRELENIIERGMIITKSNVLELGEWLPKVIIAQKSGLDTNAKSTSSLEDIERQHIVDTLNKTGWKIRGEDGAAKMLDINPTTLEARIKKLGISKER